jgi:hypothetical protein
MTKSSGNFMVGVALKRLSQAARVNVHRDIPSHIVQSLKDLEHPALSQLHARLERITFHHTSHRERFLQTALRDPAVGLQPLKTTRRMVDEEKQHWYPGGSRPRCKERCPRFGRVFSREPKFLLPSSCPPFDLTQAQALCRKRNLSCDRCKMAIYLTLQF